MKRSLIVGAALLAVAACGDDGGTGDVDADTSGDAALSISPAMQDFGTVGVGSSSAAATFSVSNTGTAASSTISTSASGDFSITADGCTGQALAPSSSCTISVVFSPSAAGAATGSLTATATDGGSAAATLEGEGATVGALTISPTPHAYGDVVVGATSASQAFTVENTGGSDTGSISASVSGGDSTQFTMSGDGCSGEVLAAGETCTINVEFTPNSSGAKSSAISVTAGPGGTATATISGNALADADLDVSPISRDFGSVTEDTDSGNVSFTVTNNGGVTSGTIANTLSGTDAADFTIQTSSCAGNTLAAGASCTVIVRFTPGAGSTGAKTASLDVTGAPGGTASSVLTGDSLAAGALEVVGSPFDFGTATVGTTGNSVVITVTNQGGSATGPLSTALGGANPTDFPVVAGGNGCAGVALAAGASCTISLSFNPTAPGARGATLSVSGTPGGTVSPSLFGTALAPATLSVTPPQLDFGSVATNAQSSTVNFTVTNTGDATSGVPNVNIGGTNFGQFSLVANGCTAALAGGASCTIMIRFVPTSLGLKNAVLEVDSTPGGADTSNLSGTGITPAALSILPTTQGYGNIVEDQTSTFTTFTVTNGGAETSGTLATSLAAPDGAHFEIGTNNCIGTQLLSGASCTVQVRFAPTTPGAKASTLVVTGTPGGSPGAALSGTALEKLILNPASHDFGGLLVGDVTGTQVFQLTNTAVAPARTVAATITGANAGDFSITANNCPVAPATLGSGANCNITVHFTPTGTPGPRVAALSVTGSGGAAVTAALDAEVEGPIQVTQPTTLPHDYGEVVVGQGINQTFRVTNLSPTLPSGAISTAFTPAGDYAIVDDNCAGVSLAANGGFCNIVVRFFPQSSGTATGSFRVSSAIGNDVADFTGLGRDRAVLASNPTSHDFGQVATTNSASQTFVITNGGEETADNIVVGLVGNTTRYSITANNCSSGTASLAPAATCSITVRFLPPLANAPGDYATTLEIDYVGDITGNNFTLDVEIDGESVSQLTMSPTPFAFADTVEGGQTGTTTFTVTNIGGATSNSLQTTLSDTTNFQLVTNNCGNVAAGANCTLLVRFRPQTDGNFTATLTSFANNGAVAVAELSGRGLQVPVLTVDPTDAFYGFVELGSISQDRTFTFTNIGEVTTGSLMTSLSVVPDWTIITDNCGGTMLAAAASCTVVVRFTPDTSGTTWQNTVLTVTDGAASAGSNLEGYASPTDQAIILQPGFVEYADTVEGQQSAVINFTITNASAVTLSGIQGLIWDNRFSGPNTSTDFTISTNNCSSLPAGGACTMGLRFTPGSPGLKVDLLQIIGSGPGITTAGVAELRGTGLDGANITMSPAGTNNFGNVATGTSGSVTYTLTNIGEETSGNITTTLSGNDTPHYNLSNNNCAGTTLAPAGTCTFDVNFAPVTAGTKTATITAANAATPGGTPGQSRNRSLTGVGVTQALIGITPSADQTCASRPGGWTLTTAAQRCAAETFLVSNLGGVPTGPLTFGVTNTDFTTDGSGVLASNCVDGAPIAAGGSCTIRVWYTPQTANESDSTVLNVSASPGGSDSVNFASSSTPAISLLSGTGAFGGTTVGSFTQQSLTFQNSANTPATGVLTVTLADANTQFAIVSDSCSGGTEAAGGQCTVQVRFVPTSTGSKTATLTVSDGTVNKTATVNLTGTGNNPAP